MEHIIFNSSLPRSGSTLLQNILGQNPMFHVTPTNALLEMVVGVRDRWQDLIEFRAQPQKEIMPRVIGSMRGIIEGFYEKELREGRIVVDKSRGWLAYIELMEQVMGRPVTILSTIRDVRAIVASFEKLYRANPVTVRREQDYCAAQTVEGRTAILLQPGGVVGLAVNRLRDALRRNTKSQLLLVPYRRLTTAPKKVLADIHERLGLEPFSYDFENVEQVTYEDDAVHGLPLHTIRRKVESPVDEPWKGIIPPALADRIAAEYADIQSMAG
jgi:sulfotransferase